jgi:energy-converting hydrogenase A subunit M
MRHPLGRAILQSTKNMEQAYLLFQQVMSRVEKELGFPADFMINLLREDDWSFLIKIHAVIEAAITKTLCSHLDPKLISIFEQLELNDSRTGKTAFAKSLLLLTCEQRQFITELSKVRNKVVHDIKRVSFKFSDFVKELDKNQRKNFIDAIISFTTSPEGKTAWRKYATEDPKVAIWANTFSLLIRTTTDAKSARIEKEIRLEKAKLWDDTFGKLNNANK